MITHQCPDCMIDLDNSRTENYLFCSKCGRTFSPDERGNYPDAAITESATFTNEDWDKLHQILRNRNHVMPFHIFPGSEGNDWIKKGLQDEPASPDEQEPH
jgi:predicted amidophosphoribosyltransferase